MDRQDWKIIALFCGIGFAVVASYVGMALLFITTQLPSEGITGVASLTKYEMDGATLQTKLDWGVVTNGTHKQQSILKNTGNIPLKLSMTTDEAYDWIELSWNCTDYVLDVGSQVTVEWTLAVTNAPTNTPFTFNIEITGTET